MATMATTPRHTTETRMHLSRLTCATVIGLQVLITVATLSAVAGALFAVVVAACAVAASH